MSKDKKLRKDPAVLFYVSDFLTGTLFMSNEQVGIYMRLLCAQHQHGGLIDKVSFNSLIGTHELIKAKFIESSDGYYNERLFSEMELRNQKSNNLSEAGLKVWAERKLKKEQENAIALQLHQKDIQLHNNSSTKASKKDAIAMQSINTNTSINETVLNNKKDEQKKSKPLENLTTENLDDKLTELQSKGTDKQQDKEEDNAFSKQKINNRWAITEIINKPYELHSEAFRADITKPIFLRYVALMERVLKTGENEKLLIINQLMTAQEFKRILSNYPDEQIVAGMNKLQEGGYYDINADMALKIQTNIGYAINPTSKFGSKTIQKPTVTTTLSNQSTTIPDSSNAPAFKKVV